MPEEHVGNLATISIVKSMASKIIDIKFRTYYRLMMAEVGFRILLHVDVLYA